jgi:UPF0755 protein
MPAKRRPTARGGAWRALGLLLVAGFALGAGIFVCGLTARTLDPARIGSPAAGLSLVERLALGTYLGMRSDALNRASPNAQGGSLTIAEGENASTLASRLASEGWISEAAVFRTYLRFTGGDRKLFPGLYAMPPNITTRMLADLLVSGSSRQIELTVFPGWRVEELASALAQHGVPIPAADFIAASHRRPGSLALYLAIPAQTALEGFLLPGRYLVERSANADLLVFEMASAFERALTDDLRRTLETRGLSLYQAVTLASIVEREAMHNDEMPLIASVFLNRVDSGMLLEADPTVQYALGFYPPQATWWRSPLSSGDLQVDSPFNTYLYGGLPPSPICNPSLDALLAVANAPATSYYFFRAACDGSGRHLFAETYNQHLSNACP